jgi:NAD-dependent SIR2 family protein deacetylase
MIAGLSELSKTAQPTPFHELLRTFDRRSQLLRVYTQNIDALESRCGLSFGIPDGGDRRPRNRGKAKPSGDIPILADENDDSRLPSPPIETPRCIPLHGTIQTMYCKTCTHSFPLENYLSNLLSGQLALCPECQAIEETRQLVGKRARGVGLLRPGVVLYNEDHKDSEKVGEVVAKDLMGGARGRSPPDLLLVVGTSLRVPGTKTIVRQFSKAVRSRDAATSSGTESASSRLPTPSPSPRRTPAGEDAPIRTIYLNYDFPVPTRDWEGIFDVWVKGDAQTFARIVQEAIAKQEEEKAAAALRRAQKQAEAVVRNSAKPPSSTKKRKMLQDPAHRTTKKRKTTYTSLLTPPSTPPPRLTVKLKPPSTSALAPSHQYPSLVEPDARHRTGIVICIPPRPPTMPPSNHQRRRKCEVWINKPHTTYKAHRHNSAVRVKQPAAYGVNDARADSLSDISDLTEISDPEDHLLPERPSWTRQYELSSDLSSLSDSDADVAQRPLISPG